MVSKGRSEGQLYYTELHVFESARLQSEEWTGGREQR